MLLDNASLRVLGRLVVAAQNACVAELIDPIANDAIEGVGLWRPWTRL